MPNLKQCPQCGALYPDDVRFCTQDGAILSQQGVTTDMVGRVLSGKYRVERLIGSGGMGDVFLVRHVQLDQMRAVKRMQSATVGNAANRERFRREARQQGKIRHPNVATLYDFEEEQDGSCYLVMEFVDGQSLGDLIRAHEPIPVTRVAAIVTQIAAALDAAHEAGVVHRDLKPDNVLITRERDDTDLVKLVDFGIATLISDPERSSRITSTGFVIGTPRYMSPEQIMSRADQPIDGRSDIYTLALLAMEMLVRELPFGSQNLTDVLRRAASPPPKLSTLAGAASLPPALDAVFARALDTDRNMRQASAGEFAREFVEVLRNAGFTSGVPAMADATSRGSGGHRAPTVSTGPATASSSAPVRARQFAIASAVVLAAILVFVFVNGDEPGSPVTNAADSTTDQNQQPVAATGDGAAIAATDSLSIPKTDTLQSGGNTQSGGAGRGAESRGAAENNATETSRNNAVLRLRQLEVLDEPTAASANERIQEVRRIFPLLITPQDSISAELVMIEAMYVLQDVSGICARLPRLRRMSTGTNFASSVAFWSDSLPCRRPL